MARRRLYWHLGPADTATTFLAHALDERSAELAALGLRVQATPVEASLATHELLRTHRAADLKRADVEGTWAEILDRIWKHKGNSVLSTPLLCAADREQLELALDGLRGIEVHLVLLVRPLPALVHDAWNQAVTAGAGTSLQKYLDRVLEEGSEHDQAVAYRAGHDLPALLQRWTRTFHPDRVHVVDVDSDAASIWNALMNVAGTPGVAVPEGTELVTLSTAATEVVRQLNKSGGEATPAVSAAAASLMPSTDVAPSAPVGTDLVARTLAGWTKAFADKGYDVRGSFSPAGIESDAREDDPLDVATAALAASSAEISALRRRVAELEHENKVLDKKRRKHKRRLKQVDAA